MIHDAWQLDQVVDKARQGKRMQANTTQAKTTCPHHPCSISNAYNSTAVYPYGYGLEHHKSLYDMGL